MSSKAIAATFALLLSVLISVANAAPPAAPTPKVAFVGDWLTDSWSATFPANWIDYDQKGGMAAAIAQKPSLIHLMVGSAFWDDDASYNLVTAELEEYLTQNITQARAAGIPIVIGMEPSQFFGPESLHGNLEIYAIATQYGVPIINYNGAFNGAGERFAGGSLYTGPAPNVYSSYQPTPAGYAIMAMMAQTAFSTLNAQPKSVYLQNTEPGSEDTPIVNGQCCTSLSNVNTVEPGNGVNFYPVISYTNGVSEQAGFNTDYLTQQIGTWTSSNPSVGYVDQFGDFGAFNQGQTTVKFTLPNGVWNEWIMYVGAPSP